MGQRGGTTQLARVANEYATVAVDLDARGNSPRLRVRSLRDGHEVSLDAAALALLCQIDTLLLRFLADAAVDAAARHELQEWLTGMTTLTTLDGSDR
ncbi:MAG: hypothetical protein AB1679_02085 [Actinomycetota bacterium]|jgi:hypothetical protein